MCASGSAPRTLGVCIAVFAASLAARPADRRGVHAAPRRRRDLGSRHDAVHDLVRGGVQARAPDPRRCCSSFPQVTTVANELGRARRRAPIRSGSSTTSISSGSSHTAIQRGTARFARRQQLTDAIEQKLEAFPGIIFNFTQPAEDAVDEAETGLKSSLAVKIFGSDLETLEAKAEAVAQGARRRPRHHRHHPGPRARATEPHDRTGPREDRAATA